MSYNRGFNGGNVSLTRSGTPPTPVVPYERCHPKPKATAAEMELKLQELTQAVARLTAALKELDSQTCADIADMRARIKDALIAEASGRTVIRRGNAISLLIDTVATVTGIHETDIRSDRRTTKPTRARQIVCWLARRYTNHSLPEIGLVLRRDHTSVLHATRKIDRIAATISDPPADDPVEWTAALWRAYWGA